MNERSSLDRSSAIVLANSLVSSKLDYCNSFFYGLPDLSLHRLQLVQNALARVVVPTVLRSITFLPLFVPCIGFLFPNALHSRLLPSLSKHYRIINLPIFAIFSFLTVPLIHFALLTNICSPYLSSNLPKLVDHSSLLLQLSGILFLSLSVLLPPVHRSFLS